MTTFCMEIRLNNVLRAQKSLQCHPHMNDIRWMLTEQMLAELVAVTEVNKEPPYIK